MLPEGVDVLEGGLVAFGADLVAAPPCAGCATGSAAVFVLDVNLLRGVLVNAGGGACCGCGRG